MPDGESAAEELRWNLLGIGYEAGVRDAIERGIEIGRAQVEAEYAALWRQVRLTCDAIADQPGPLGHAERERWRRRRARELDPDAGLSGEQLREKAARSWGLAYVPRSTAADRMNGPDVPRPCHLREDTTVHRISPHHTDNGPDICPDTVTDNLSDNRADTGPATGADTIPVLTWDGEAQ